jgi:tetratricopeptide (TPR) repeat protein
VKNQRNLAVVLMVLSIFIFGILIFSFYSNKEFKNKVVFMYKRIVVNIPIMSLNKELKNDPNNIIISRNIGSLYNETSYFEKALVYALRAYDLDRNDLATVELLADIYISLKDNKEALTKIEEALKIEKGKKQTDSMKAHDYYNIALLYKKMYMYSDASKMINITLGLQKDSKIEIEKDQFVQSDVILNQYLQFKNEIAKEMKK